MDPSKGLRSSLATWPSRALRSITEKHLDQWPRWASQPMAEKHLSPWPRSLGPGQERLSTSWLMSSLADSAESYGFPSSRSFLYPLHQCTDAQCKPNLMPLSELGCWARPSSLIKEGRGLRPLISLFFNLYKMEALTHFKESDFFHTRNLANFVLSYKPKRGFQKSLPQYFCRDLAPSEKYFVQTYWLERQGKYIDSPIGTLLHLCSYLSVYRSK